ncbi:MAG: hypothetical protein LN412_04340 [Candidatus Thermoplasmatota archaeon]|nr:hypothetical protein [Candidatus Thermoplasmatota archaeon]
MDEGDRELMEGMGNCYQACGENFEETVGMVARARAYTPEEVKTRLHRIREENGDTAEYRELRARLPEDFPF